MKRFKKACHFVELERTNVCRLSEKVIQAMESGSMMTMFLEDKREPPQ
jgi:hypothetical protein